MHRNALLKSQFLLPLFSAWDLRVVSEASLLSIFGRMLVTMRYSWFSSSLQSDNQVPSRPMFFTGCLD